jgi:DNA-binding NarL/FixJ family response regulator
MGTDAAPAPHDREPALIGRARELSFFDEALTALGHGLPRSVAVVGEPGIGKSALLGVVFDRVRAQGFGLLAARAGSAGQRLAFIAAAQPRDGDGRSAPAAHPAARCAALAKLRAALGLRRADSGGQATAIERLRAHGFVRAAIDEIAAQRPLVIAVDDLHDADAATIALIGHLLRRPASVPVLLALTYRPAQASARLHDELAGAVREGSLRRIDLAPLGRDEAEQVIGPDVDAPTGERLRHLSGGNPFYLTELLREGTPRQPTQAAPPAPPPDAVPAAVAEAAAQELRALSQEAAALAHAAAVLGERFELDLAMQIGDLSDRNGLPALDELLDRDLLRGSDAPRRYRFRHPLLRDAIYAGIDPARRSALHANARRALVRRRAPVASIAAHLQCCAVRGDMQAVALLTQAGRATRTSAPAQAARSFAAALRVLPDDACDEQRLRLLVSHATALGAAGRVAEGRSALQGALSLAPAGVDRAHGRIAAAMAGLDHLVGERGDAQRLLEQALSSVAERPSRAGAALRLELAITALFCADWERTSVLAREARDEAGALNERVLLAVATSVLAVAEHSRGATDDARRLVAVAGELTDLLTDVELARRLDALAFLGLAEAAIEHFGDAVRHLTRALRIARQTGRPPWSAFILIVLGFAQMSVGLLQEAARSAKAAIDAADALGQGRVLLWAQTLRCWVLTHQGDLEGAVDAGEHAAKLADRFAPVAFGGLAYSCLAAALLEAGDAPRARRTILERTGGPELVGSAPCFRPRSFELLACIELAQGNIGAAERWVVRAETAAATVGQRARLGEAQRARASLELARGDAAKAAGAAADACESFQAVGARVDAARARMLAARALVVLGDGDRAADEFEHAHRVLAIAGAARHRDDAVRELRRLRRRAPTDGVNEPLEVLSAREREVAELVSRGMSNRQIAAELFLSAKTVERHLSRIFSKVSVCSRAELAAVVQRERVTSATPDEIAS